jgi:hypothetical protein
MTDWASYCETGTWGNVMNIIEKKAA